MNPRAFHQPFYPLLALCLITLAACLVAFQPPPATGTGSGSVTVQVRSASDTPLAGVTVRYLDEWQRHVHATCTTDNSGSCLLMLTDAPALGEMVRGVIEIGGRLHDAMFLAGEHITVKVTLDASGALDRGADVLATRDPSLTPTLIGVEDALATLTAAAVEPLATPSPGIVLTIVEAHARMTATTVARHTQTPLTPTPRVSNTPVVGIAIVVNTSPVATEMVPNTPLSVPPYAEETSTLFQVLATVAVVLVVGLGVFFTLRHHRNARQRTGGSS